MVLPVPFTTAAYLCVAIRRVAVFKVAKKFAMKLWNSSIDERLLLVHIKAASVALGSEIETFTKKHAKRRRTNVEWDIKVGCITLIQKSKTWICNILRELILSNNVFGLMETGKWKKWEEYIYLFGSLREVSQHFSVLMQLKSQRWERRRVVGGWEIV